MEKENLQLGCYNCLSWSETNKTAQRYFSQPSLLCFCEHSVNSLLHSLYQQAQDAGFSSEHLTRQRVLLSWLHITRDLLQDCTIQSSANFFWSQFAKLRQLNSISFLLYNRPHNFTYPGNYFSYTETFFSFKAW